MTHDKTMVRANLIGIGFMIAAMAGFAFEDALIKSLSVHMPVGQVLIMIGVIGTIIWAIIARIQGVRFVRAHVLDPNMLARNLSELIGTCGFVAALSMIDISTLSAIIQVNPLLVTMGAALFLNETVGPRRWTAIFIGLLGVMIILRPGTDGFEIGYIWALIGVIGLSARDVLTRKVDANIPTVLMATMGFVAVIPAGGILLVFDPRWASMDVAMMGGMVGVTAVGMIAYVCIILATRIGEISAIMPFRYSRLIFGALIGVFVFAETIDLWTAVGALLIVITGLYTFWREMKVGR